ncbi:MAG: hypothetical protein KDB80_10855, partial [Planctomycetes bacterium]|nr:hypothetical protein [Planctomycetota bacterium]
AGGLLRTAVESAEPRADDAFEVDVRVVAARRGLFDDVVRDVQREVSFVVDPTSDSPLRGVADRLESWGVVPSERAGTVVDRLSVATDDERAIACVERSAVLLDASTLEVDIVAAEFAPAGVRVARAGDRLRVALWSRGEVGVLADAPSPGSTLWLVLRPTDATAPDLALAVSVGRAADPDLLDLAAAHFQIEDSVERREIETSAFSEQDRRRTGLELAWEGLADEASARAALAMLAPSPVSIVHDVSLVAESPAITACAGHVRDSIEPDFDDPERTRWSVEREIVALIASRVEQEECTPGEPAMLLRHFGEFGRFPAELALAARRTGTANEFASRVVAENWRALDASDPASRVRALDWLEHRGAAPRGFDPFGSRESRRTVLRAAEESRAEVGR